MRENNVFKIHIFWILFVTPGTVHLPNEKINYCTCCIFHAQKTTIPVKSGDILITPGIGVGSLKLGMNEAAAYKILKGDITWKNYKDEMKVFKSYGESNFAIDSIAQFILGFDSCAAYGGDLSEVMPVYSLYFDNHKLNILR